MLEMRPAMHPAILDYGLLGGGPVDRLFLMDAPQLPYARGPRLSLNARKPGPCALSLRIWNEPTRGPEGPNCLPD